MGVSKSSSGGVSSGQSARAGAAFSSSGPGTRAAGKTTTTTRIGNQTKSARGKKRTVGKQKS
jgi:hypothetical protein